MTRFDKNKIKKTLNIKKAAKENHRREKKMSEINDDIYDVLNCLNLFGIIFVSPFFN